MFPEMFGYENTLFGPRGKAHEALGRCKRKFCGGQRPDARVPGVWGQTPRSLASGPGVRVGLLPCGPNRPCAGKTDLEEAFTPSLDPKAQHINRGAGLAHGTHQDFPKPCAATLTL
jgi:hypothetical protein